MIKQEASKHFWAVAAVFCKRSVVRLSLYAVSHPSFANITAGKLSLYRLRSMLIPGSVGVAFGRKPNGEAGSGNLLAVLCVNGNVYVCRNNTGDLLKDVCFGGAPISYADEYVGAFYTQCRQPGFVMV